MTSLETVTQTPLRDLFVMVGFVVLFLGGLLFRWLVASS